MLNIPIVYELAREKLSKEEGEAVILASYKRADEMHVSHLSILPSMLITAMQEKGIDCSVCYLPNIPENA